jgi:hypothetical protein
MIIYLIFQSTSYEANGGMGDCMGMGTDKERMLARAKELSTDVSKNGHVVALQGESYELIHEWGDNAGLSKKESREDHAFLREIPVI